MLVKNRIILQKIIQKHLTKQGECDMFIALKGWFPGNSRVIERGERVFIGDHLGLVSMHHARGLTISALGGRLSLLTAAMADKVA